MNPELHYILCNMYVPIICVGCFFTAGCIKCCCVDSKETIHNDENNDNNLDDELYGVKTVDATPEVKAQRAKNNNKRGNNELKNAYADMMKNMYSNKLLMIIFLILIIVIVYVMKRK